MTTTIPSITPLPPSPQRTDPSTFSVRADASLTAQETVFVPQLNAFATAVNTVGTEMVGLVADATTQVGLAANQVTLAANQVTLAANQVTLATTQANNAANSATAAANSALVGGATMWVSGTTYSVGDARYSPINFQTYRRTIAGAGTTDPSLDTVNWTLALEKGGIANVVTATGNTTLTSTASLLQITPTSYGVSVTLPDATTCKLGGPLHIIDNKGAYPVRVLDSTGVLKGFVFAGVVSHVSLTNKTTAAGIWSIENSELVGASAQLLTTNMFAIAPNLGVIALDANRELILGAGPAANYFAYGVVYDKSTNMFGSVTLIRSVAINGWDGTSYIRGVLSGANQVLCVSCNNGTAFEAVALTISGTSITVNTAAAATLSANIGGFADGCGLIAVGASFVTSYTVSTPAAQIRALSISGTTVTIGAASVLAGTAGGLIAAAANHVIAASVTANIFITPYLVSGATLTLGTGTTTTSSGATLHKFAALGTRWFVGYRDPSMNIMGGVVSLTATGNGTTAISVATMSAGGAIADAIVVGSNKVLVLDTATSNNANILTDTAGTASAGTAITLSSGTTRAALYVSGTTAIVVNASSILTAIDCAGASPVLGYKVTGSMNIFGSNTVLSRSPNAMCYGSSAVYTTNTGYTVTGTYNTFTGRVQVIPGATWYRGSSASSHWQADGATVITKMECAV